MKIDFYVDIWPGIKPDALTATTTPYKKYEGVRRYKITANIPDHAFTGVIDGAAPVEAVVEVDEDTE